MTVQEWLEDEVKYGRKVLDAGLEGTRSGREAFLNRTPLTPYLNNSVRKALTPAAIGTCIGVCAGVANRNRSVGRILTFALLGGAIGFVAGLTWERRRLIASELSAARKRIDSVRDEHWLERNPIDYA